ncbi:ATP-binding protein [Micropruina sp.]|uniref:sensor histidine kinase n=1 Tax=Micropruina sp. TaxID=2737536 RepID=UPI00261F2AAB|nr:ATP-binding protein [Micropruina sp.]
MTSRRSAGHLGRADSARGPSAAGLRLGLARAVALTCLATLIPALFLAFIQLPHLHPLWLATVGGGIIGFSLLLPVYAWSFGDVRWLCGAYALVSLLGLATWVWAWTSPLRANHAPWLWMCVGIAAVCAAIATTVPLGFVYTVVSALVFGAVRMTRSGGDLSALEAMQDVLTLLVLPTALLLLIRFFANAVDELDATTADSQQVEADRAIDRALHQQRTVLDGIIHDRVMTTLVAAVQTDQSRGEVAELARTALDAVADAGSAPDGAQLLDLHQLARLIEDMVDPVCPLAEVIVDASGDDLTVTAAVASVLGQAAREAALNVSRHAEAENCTITVSARMDRGDQQVRVDIRDDGKGFDPEDLPENRFGIRVSMRERLTHIGGTVDISSRPGEGTRVSLLWVGREQRSADAAARRRVSQALRSVLRVEVFVFLVWLMVGVQVLVGWLASLGEDSDWTPVALGLAVFATAVALWRAGERRISNLGAIVVVLCLAVISELAHVPMPAVRGLGYASWHGTVVMVLLITVLVRGRREIAWVGLGVFVVQALVWTYGHDLGPYVFLDIVFGPLLWMVLATLVVRGVRSIGEQLVRVRSASRQNTQAMAESFSKLVLREVWLAELRAQIGPLLQNLADPAHQLSAEERDACRVLEGRLRDALRAGNLVSQGVSDAIQAARGRGVEVVLVDNRGSRLPETVRRETLRQLERLVRDSTGGRIVARTAPEGYAEAVTILRVDAERNLTTIDEAGTVTVRKT